jgi:hypothetical protein
MQLLSCQTAKNRQKTWTGLHANETSSVPNTIGATPILSLEDALGVTCAAVVGMADMVTLLIHFNLARWLLA